METYIQKKSETAINVGVVVLALTGLYFTTLVNYLLFHALAEGFSIVIASCTFIIAWNSKKYIRSPYLLFIGIAYLFVAFIDMMHTLSYKGMGIFTDYSYYANQLWICARYMESLTLLIAFMFIKKDTIHQAKMIFVTYAVITAVVIASVFYWKIFPVCFVDGSGLTPFKKNSEYVICFILFCSIGFLYNNRKRFPPKIFTLIAWSILFTILSELAFTFYIDNYGFSNLVGHYFKIISFLFVYEAILRTGIKDPLALIFHDL
jgi:hypothetical protein